MKKGVVIILGLFVILILLFSISLVSAGFFRNTWNKITGRVTESGEITGECTYYDRGIEYERCCPMDDKINCVSCRDTDGGRDYYIKGETREWHWNYYERGALASGGGLEDECIEIIPLSDCPGTIIKEATNDSYGLCELSQQIKLYGGGISRVSYVDELNKTTYYVGPKKITVLREGYCITEGEYQKYKSEEYICPNGCVDGACVRDDGCPNVIGWRIEGIKCIVDSGCDYDSSIYDYYDSAEDCINGLGKVERPVLEPLPVPDICSDLLIEQDIGDYSYRETKYSRMGPDVYSEDGRKIATSKCCVAYYKKSVVSAASILAYVCPLPGEGDVRNSIKWGLKRDIYSLGEYMNQTVYWMRKDNYEALLWTKNNNVLALGDQAGGVIPDDIAQAYIEKHNSDLGEEGTEAPETPSEPEPTPLNEIEEPIGEPVDIPEEKLFYSCEGCEMQGKCYPIGYREEGQYCGIDNQFVAQLRTGTCNNNFECRSNVCVNGECISKGLMKKVINWFRGRFGNV